MTDRDQVDEILDHWRRERPELDASPIGVFGRVARIDRLLDSLLADFLGANGLTLGLFDVLAALRRTGAPYSAKPSVLAATSLLTSGGMTPRLDQLEELGLVVRVKDPADRRVVLAQLSDSGLGLIDKLIEDHLEWEASLLRDLSRDERDRLANLLRTVEAAMYADGSG